MNAPSMPAPSSLSATARRLSAAVTLDSDDLDFLETIQCNRAFISAGEAILNEGDRVESSFLQRSGWSFRWDMTPAGRRQILNLYLPGDTIELDANHSRVALYTLTALTDVEVAMIEPRRLVRLWEERPMLARGLEWSQTRERSILAEHNVSLGARTAPNRILHLLLELWCRLMLVGEADDSGFDLPLNQQQLGEVCGLSLVHTNKSISKLSKAGLVRWQRNRVRFASVSDAMRSCDFDPRFLDVLRDPI